MPDGLGDHRRYRCLYALTGCLLSYPVGCDLLSNDRYSVTLESLQNWESGRRSPRADVALALADFLRQHKDVKKIPQSRPK
jgi:hypothetical protein